MSKNLFTVVMESWRLSSGISLELVRKSSFPTIIPIQLMSTSSTSYISLHPSQQALVIRLPQHQMPKYHAPHQEAFLLSAPFRRLIQRPTHAPTRNCRSFRYSRSAQHTYGLPLRRLQPMWAFWPLFLEYSDLRIRPSNQARKIACGLTSRYLRGPVYHL